MSHTTPVEKEPLNSRWNSSHLKSCVNRKLREMGIEIDKDKLGSVVRQEKNRIQNSCPENISLDDYATEQLTSYIVDGLATEGDLIGIPEKSPKLPGVSTEKHYDTKLYECIEDLRLRYLTENADDVEDGMLSPEHEEKLTKLISIAKEIWNLVKPDLSRRQDRDDLFCNWISEAREHIEVICALDNEEERHFELMDVKRKRDLLEHRISDEKLALDLHGKYKAQEQKKKKIQKTKHKESRPKMEIPESSQMAATRASAVSSTDSARTQSLTAMPAGPKSDLMDFIETEQKIRRSLEAFTETESDSQAFKDEIESIFGKVITLLFFLLSSLNDRTLMTEILLKCSQYLLKRSV
eukprot:g3150.t1